LKSSVAEKEWEGPLLYGTTPLFLEHFALRHLGELPRGDELAIALRDPNAPLPAADEPAPPEAEEDSAIESTPPAQTADAPV
jgi:hypothetical protein